MKFQRVLAASSLACCSVALSSNPWAQQMFANTPTQIPATGSYTENVDFGDVDLDGDWDAAIADGGDVGNDQDRLFINQGHLQAGAVGAFVDGTTARLPAISDDSRDIDFVDFDGDGDLDLHNSNTSSLSNQGNRWWTNRGGLQGGTLGFYQDETLARWVGLGVAPSSIALSQVLAGGGFIDWTGDSEFGDLDGDGDLDLVHSSYGGFYSGVVPTRVFTNNGLGFYSEFNPSGQLWAYDGGPGLWCDGTQSSKTIDTTGLSCDVAEAALDVDVADIDGDLDLDVLLGSRSGEPRMYRNRLVEQGALAFRDVTGAPGVGSFPASWGSGDGEGHEFADVDGDDDVDLFGVQWLSADDGVFPNAGNGQLGAAAPLSGTTAGWHTEGDFGDLDGDGDLDLFVSTHYSAASSHVYVLGLTGYAQVSDAATGLMAPARSWDADLADVDEDGDYDAMTAEDANQHERLYLNQTLANDVTAPRFAHAESLPNQVAAPGTVGVRTQLYDNSPYYVAWFDQVAVEVSVAGCPLPLFEASSSYGQVFRAPIPKNLVGAVQYQWQGTDEHGNTGATGPFLYTATSGLAYASHFGAGSPGTFGVPTLNVASVPFAGTTLYLVGSVLPPGTQWLLGMTTAAIPGAPLTLPGICNLNVAGSILFTKGGQANVFGCAAVPIAVPGSAPAGVTVYAQFFGFDGTGGNLLSASDGVAITTQ